MRGSLPSCFLCCSGQGWPEFLLFPLGRAGRAAKKPELVQPDGQMKTKVSPGSLSHPLGAELGHAGTMLLEKRVRIEGFWKPTGAGGGKAGLLAAPGPLWSCGKPSLVLVVGRRQRWAPGCSSAPQKSRWCIFEMIPPLFSLANPTSGSLPLLLFAPVWEQL